MATFKKERGRRRAAPLLFALLGVFQGVWSFVLSPRLPGFDRPRSFRKATEEKQGTRSVNGTSLKEEMAEILKTYELDGSLPHLERWYQSISDSGATLSTGLYNKALQAMITTGRPAHVKEFFGFIEKQVQPDATTYDHLVTSLLETGDHQSALKTLLSAPKVLLKTCKRMLRSLLEGQKDFTSATRLMSCLPAMGLQPTYPMYKGMVTAAAEEGNLDTAEAWFQQLNADGFQPDSGLFASLIKGGYKAKDPESALRYFNLMQGADLQPTKGAYSFLIRSLAEDKQADAAVSWMERMVGEGFDPDLEIHEAVLEAAAKRVDMRRELEHSWVNSLKAAGVKRPKKEVYQTIIRVAAKYGDISSASQWLTKMQESGQDCGLNEYNYLLKAAEYMNDVHSAQKFFQRAEKAGAKPDAESYNLVIKTMAKAGKPKLAEKWAMKMEKQGLLTSKSLQFDLVTQSVAASGNAADYAAKWVTRAVNLEKPLSTASYRAVMRAYLDEGNSSAARQWFEQMHENGTPADYETFLMLMRYDDRQTAVWHSKMEDAGIPPTTESFNLVIRSFGDVKGSLRMEKVEEWYERMLNAGVKPDQETFAQLIAASVKSRKVDPDKWFTKMVDSGFSPDVSVYKSLMMRSLINRDPIGVRQILDWMVLKGMTIHRGVYNIAIRAFSEANEPEKAEEIFQRLKVAGRYPDERTYTFLIEARAQEGSMEKARAWFSEMRKEKIRPDFRSYAALIAGYAKQGDVASTKEFLQEIELRKFHGLRRAAWTGMMLPALQCLKKAGEEAEVAKWIEYSAEQGFELSQEEAEVEEVSEDETPSVASRNGKRRRAKRSKGEDVDDPLAALEALKAAGKTPGIRDYNRVMKQLASSPRSRFSLAKAFLEDTVIPAVTPNEETFSNLLRCNRRGDGKRGVYTLEWMSEKGFAVKRSHTSRVVRQLFQDFADGKVANIDSLLEKILACLKEKKDRSDLYDTVIRQAAEDDLLNIADDWATRSRKEGLLIPMKTCYSMAKVHFRKGDEISSLWWIEAAGKEKGSTPLIRLGRFVDTVTAFRSTGDGSKRSPDVGLVDRTAAFMTRLSSDSTIPKEEVPYINIMEAYCRAKRPQGASDWLDKMAASTGTPPVEAYNAVIRSYAEVGDMESASKWLARLQAETQPDFDSYQAVIDAYASNGDSKKLDEIWKELTAAGFTPTDETYCSMLRALCIAQDAEKVEVWVSRFEWEGIQFNLPTFSTLVRFYLQQGELSKALTLSEEMAMTDLFEIGSGLWLEQLKAARDQNDSSHAKKVASAMVRHGYSLDEAKGLLEELLGEDSEVLVKLNA